MLTGPVRPAVVLALLCVTLAGCRDERSGIVVDKVSFTGVNAVPEGHLRDILATQSSPWLPWRPKSYFGREQFQADLKRIEAFYADRGFPNGRVRSFDVDLSEDQTSVTVTLHIHEGEPVIVEQVVLEGFAPLAEEPRRALEANLPLTQGQPLDRALVQASREAALDALRDHGFPYASVRIAESAGSTEHGRVVTLRAEPGTQARFGEVEVTGNRTVGAALIRRQLTYRPGDLYRHSSIRESQRRLYGLELIDFASIQTLDAEGQPPEIRTRVTITEGDHQKVNLGVGYGSEERARGQIDWRHVNFLGGARTANVFGRYSLLDSGVRLAFQQPYLFTPRFSLGVSGQSWYANEPAYERVTVGGRLTINRQFARVGGPPRRLPANTLAFTYVNEWEDYTISAEALADLTFRDELIALGLDPRTGRGRGQRSAVMLDFGRNTTENLLDARRGYLANLHVEQAGRWLQGGFDYYEVSTEGRFYYTLGSLGVLAVRARAASIDALGDQETRVPFFKRYFLGGATNLRGWGRFQVSPLSGAGLPIGGHSMLNFSTELRFPVRGKFGAVVFLDGGNVWPDSWDVNLNDLRYNVGPGLRYNTPIGPVRFDVGYQLNPIAGLLVNGEEQPRRFRMHFSLGHAF